MEKWQTRVPEFCGMAQIYTLNKDQYNFPLIYKGRESTLITHRDIWSFLNQKGKAIILETFTVSETKHSTGSFPFLHASTSWTI